LSYVHFLTPVFLNKLTMTFHKDDAHNDLLVLQ